MAMRYMATAAWVLAVALGGTAKAETVDEVAARVRARVESAWSVSPKPEAEQRIGFTGDFTPRGGAKMKIRCDSGPVGVVTYTRFDGGGVCAVYPYRHPDNFIWTKVAVSAPEARVVDSEFGKNGGGMTDRNGDSLWLNANPENETPEDRAEAERSRAMAACAPTDIAQALACLDKHWSAETKRTFAALPAKQVILTHMSVGMWIRNNWGLWRGGPLRAFFTDRQISHPDGMSVLILDAYWLRAQGCRLDWNDTAAVDARFDRATKGEGCSA
jgi:hypothetical protein